MIRPPWWFSQNVDEGFRAAPRAFTRLLSLTAPYHSNRRLPLGASLALLILGLGSLPASSRAMSPQSPSTGSAGASRTGPRAFHATTIAGSLLANQAPESLGQSIQRRQEFPFPARCEGNTQEMVACLWQQRVTNRQRNTASASSGSPRKRSSQASPVGSTTATPTSTPAPS